MLLGIAGCLLYVIGDFLFAATGPGQSTETIGLFTRVAYLDMAEWRMWASILCGFVGSLLYYMGFHQMYGLLDARVTEPRDRIWVRLFKVAYITGTVAWTWTHAMFMTDALIFKHVFDAYGDMQSAADIANRVFYANAPGMAAAYILCDVGLTITMIALVWKRIIPLKSTGARILATQLGNELLKSAKFYIEFYNWAREEFEIVGQYIYFLADVMKSAGDADLSKQLTDGLVALVDAASDALDS